MQAQYRNYPPANNRSPHATASRRGIAPMVGPQHAPNPAQIQHNQQLDAYRREQGKRLARKPTDKNIPDGVENLVIGDGVEEYRRLREAERKLDSLIMRKRLDITDSTNRLMPAHRTMRVWISNTAENQPWQQGAVDQDTFDFASGENATYKVRIEGRLLDEEEELDAGEKEDSAREAEKDPDAMDQDGGEGSKKTTTKAPPRPQKSKLSHFFKSITIDFDRSKHLQPDGFQSIEWKRPESAPNSSAPDANFDCLEFERKADENINVTINLVRDDHPNPERFILKKELAELIDAEEDDRANIMLGIWNYIKANNLQEDEDTRKIQCDARMRAVFGTDSVFFPNIPSLIIPMLQPVPPLSLQYTIRVDKDYISPPSTPSANGAITKPSAPTIYDILVPVPDPYRETIIAYTRNPSTIRTLKEIVQHDEQLSLTVEAIQHAKAKHAFFTSMSKDPVGFVKRWTSSQRRDLEVIMGDATRGGDAEGQGDEWRRGGENGVWAGRHAAESVGLWLARSKAG